MQRLILTASSDLSPESLAAVLAVGDIAAVVFDGAGAPAALVEAAQNAGAAALLTRDLAAGGNPWPLPSEADGAHLAGDFAAQCAAIGRRPEGVTVGGSADSRHEAMALGEAGSDYVWFGTTATLSELAAEMACWWQPSSRFRPSSQDRRTIPLWP